MTTTNSNLGCMTMLYKKISIFYIFFICISPSFSQFTGKGELLNENSLEIAISENYKNGKHPYQNIYVNYHFVIDLAETKISSTDLLEKIKSIPEILECSYDELGMKLIIVSIKKKDDSITPILKENLAEFGVKLISKSEFTYKI